MDRFGMPNFGAVYTVQEVARLLRVHRVTVLKWIQQELLASVRPPGCRKHIITKVAVEAFLAIWTRPSAPETEQDRLMADLKRRLAS